MKKIKILFYALLGEFLKIYWRFNIDKIGYGLDNSNKRDIRIVVSLKSYGRRVSSVLPYTIISLLRQTMKPDIVVLWLDSDIWNDNNLPKPLVQLKKKGLCVKYCTGDLKSFGKLIPSLNLYQNDIIITVDDDIYYSNKLVENLYYSYKKNPLSIHAFKTSSYSVDIDDEINGKTSFRPDFQIGAGGVLYPPYSLSDKVFDHNVYKKICPTADDLWFYVMGLLNNRKVVQVKTSLKISYYYIDLFYQRMHRNSCLYDSIRYTNKEMLRSLIAYFKIKVK